VLTRDHLALLDARRRALEPPDVVEVLLPSDGA
jgi:hypothetical protein